MKFNIIDGYDKTFEDIYDDFEEDYLYSKINVEDLRKKYELSKKDFSRICHLVKSNNNLERRPSHAKYYYETHHGFNLAKKVNGKIIYGGWLPTSKKHLLTEAVKICEKLSWDSEKCKVAVAKLKECN